MDVTREKNNENKSKLVKSDYISPRYTDNIIPPYYHTFRFLLIVLERLWGNEFTNIILNGSHGAVLSILGCYPEQNDMLNTMGIVK